MRSLRAPSGSKVKEEVRCYSPVTCPPIPMVYTTASRLKVYWLSALRNSVSYVVKARTMRAASMGSAAVWADAPACKESASSAPAKNMKKRLMKAAHPLRSFEA